KNAFVPASSHFIKRRDYFAALPVFAGACHAAVHKLAETADSLLPRCQPVGPSAVAVRLAAAAVLPDPEDVRPSPVPNVQIPELPVFADLPVAIADVNSVPS